MATETLKKKAEDAKEKKATFGSDIELDKFKEARRDMPLADSLESLQGSLGARTFWSGISEATTSADA